MSKIQASVIAALVPAAALISSPAFACGFGRMGRDAYKTAPLDFTVVGVFLATIVVAVMKLQGVSHTRMLAWWWSSVIAGVGLGLFEASHLRFGFSGFAVLALIAALPSLIFLRTRIRGLAIVPLLLALLFSGGGSLELHERLERYETAPEEYEPHHVDEIIF